MLCMIWTQYTHKKYNTRNKTCSSMWICKTTLWVQKMWKLFSPQLLLTVYISISAILSPLWSQMICAQAYWKSACHTLPEKSNITQIPPIQKKFSFQPGKLNHKLCSKCLPWTHACKQTRLVSLINCCNCWALQQHTIFQPTVVSIQLSE